MYLQLEYQLQVASYPWTCIQDLVAKEMCYSLIILTAHISGDTFGEILAM